MNFKRIMSILLVLSMVFALALMAGCSEPEKEKEEEEECENRVEDDRISFSSTSTANTLQKQNGMILKQNTQKV